MVRPLSSMFSFYTLTPGRRIYVLGTVIELTEATILELAKLDGDEPKALANDAKRVIEAAEVGIAQDRRALDIDAARLDPDAPARVKDKDGIVDRILSFARPTRSSRRHSRSATPMSGRAATTSRLPALRGRSATSR